MDPSIFSNILKIHASIEERIEILDFRIQALSKCQSPLVKNAFDTRRINSETTFNPRRNLQNYARSEPFLTKAASENIRTMFKLKNIVDTIKEDFYQDPDWMDSYCRILSSTIDRTLRIDQKDMDFSTAQMDYLNEMLYLRYRLKNDDIEKIGEKELRQIILNKDEKLAYKHIYANYRSDDKINKTNNTNTVSENSLIKELFGGARASDKNTRVKRSVTISIDDSMLDNIENNTKHTE